MLLTKQCVIKCAGEGGYSLLPSHALHPTVRRGVKLKLALSLSCFFRFLKCQNTPHHILNQRIDEPSAQTYHQSNSRTPKAHSSSSRRVLRDRGGTTMNSPSLDRHITPAPRRCRLRRICWDIGVITPYGRAECPCAPSSLLAPFLCFCAPPEPLKRQYLCTPVRP